MTKTLTFLGVGTHADGDVFVYDSDSDPPKVAQGGQRFDVSDEQFTTFLADPNIAPLIEEAQDLTQLTRAELEALAVKVGVENADDQTEYKTKADLAQKVEEVLTVPPSSFPNTIKPQNVTLVPSQDAPAEQPSAPAPTTPEGEKA